MNLKEFVRDTIIQIVDGVREAQVLAERAGAQVIPHLGQLYPPKAAEERFIVVRNSGGLLADLEFDIALTVNEEKGTGVAAGGTVAIFGGGLKSGSSSGSESVSRIKFHIPIVLPEQPSKK